MILSRGRRYLFIHIPKTGGTAMATALEARAMKDDIMLGDTPKARKRRRRVQGIRTAGRLWKHSTVSDIMGLLQPEELPDLFCFTMVRNPWDRAVSYYHWLQDQRFDHPAVRLARTLDFSDFLHHDRIRASFRASQSAAYMTFAGQDRCDLYIRLEHFDQDSGPLVSHLGFDLSLPHVNASDRSRDYRVYYSDADAQLLGELCAEDISSFGYQFDEIR